MFCHSNRKPTEDERAFIRRRNIRGSFQAEGTAMWLHLGQEALIRGTVVSGVEIQRLRGRKQDVQVDGS